MSTCASAASCRVTVTVRPGARIQPLLLPKDHARHPVAAGFSPLVAECRREAVIHFTALHDGRTTKYRDMRVIVASLHEVFCPFGSPCIAGVCEIRASRGRIGARTSA